MTSGRLLLNSVFSRWCALWDKGHVTLRFSYLCSEYKKRSGKKSTLWGCRADLVRVKVMEQAVHMSALLNCPSSLMQVSWWVVWALNKIRITTLCPVREIPDSILSFFTHHWWSVFFPWLYSKLGTNTRYHFLRAFILNAKLCCEKWWACTVQSGVRVTRCSGFRPSVISHFNAIISAFRDLFWRLAMSPIDWRPPLSWSLAAQVKFIAVLMRRRAFQFASWPTDG